MVLVPSHHMINQSLWVTQSRWSITYFDSLNLHDQSVYLSHSRLLINQYQWFTQRQSVTDWRCRSARWRHHLADRWYLADSSHNHMMSHTDKCITRIVDRWDLTNPGHQHASIQDVHRRCEFVGNLAHVSPPRILRTLNFTLRTWSILVSSSLLSY